MSARVEAAAKELNGYTGDCRCHEGYTSRRLIDPDCCYHEVPNHEAAVDMLKAADAITFSEAAIERAAKVMFPSYWDPDFYHAHSEATGNVIEESQRQCIDHIRAVVAALREET